MTNTHNSQLYAVAKKRRAMFLRLHSEKNISITDLARRFGVSHQRMSVMLAQAKKEK